MDDHHITYITKLKKQKEKKKKKTVGYRLQWLINFWRIFVIWWQNNLEMLGNFSFLVWKNANFFGEK
jgi:hypothetical protein